MGLRKLVVLLVVVFSVGVAAQQPPAAAPKSAPAWKNLKVLPNNADVMFAMQVFNEALGVNCLYCHVQGDFASDANPKKDTARKMLGIVRQIDRSFAGSAGAFPAGYHEVDCTTCHRGSAKPETKPTAEFYNRNESLGVGVAPPPGTRGVNLKVLPPTTQVHGDGSTMHEFRNSLGVDCGFCHGGGRPFEDETNPRKDIARNMVLMVNQINRNFDVTAPFPNEEDKVTCWTCHRGSTHPPNIYNKDYGPPKAKP